MTKEGIIEELRTIDEVSDSHIQMLGLSSVMTIGVCGAVHQIQRNLNLKHTKDLHLISRVDRLLFNYCKLHFNEF